MDKYKWREVLGRGAFGIVHLVHEHDGATPLVAKEVNLRGMSAKAQKATRNEASVLWSLKHVNIIAYRENFIHEQRLYIVMEFADAGDLHAAVKRRRAAGQRFGHEAALSTLLQCARALRHIHARHIVHRDVKAQNVFLTLSGCVKLGDFGVARVLDHTGAMALTAIGTPSHLSPEVCDAQPYSTKADIWSFGVVMFEVLALEPPFQSENILALVARITTGEPRRVALEPFGEDVWKLVHSMLQKGPAERPCAGAILGSSFLTHASDCAGPGALSQGVDTGSSASTTAASCSIEALEDAGDALDGLLAQEHMHVETLSAEAVLEAVQLPPAVDELTCWVTPSRRPSLAKKRGVTPPLELSAESRDCLDELLEFGAEVRRQPSSVASSIGSGRQQYDTSGAADRCATSTAAAAREPGNRPLELVAGFAQPECAVQRRQSTPQRKKSEDALALNIRGTALGVLPRPRRSSEDDVSALKRALALCRNESHNARGQPIEQPAPSIITPDYPRLLGPRKELHVEIVSPTAAVRELSVDAISPAAVVRRGPSPTVAGKIHQLRGRKFTV